jgi:hypothetical protein
MPAILSLTAEQAERKINQLAELLVDAVDSGVSVGFMPPLGEAEALAYWRTVIAAVRERIRILLIALDGDFSASPPLRVSITSSVRPNRRATDSTSAINAFAKPRRRARRCTNNFMTSAR